MEVHPAVLQGRLNEIPKVTTGLLKLYVCSTAAGFTYERRWLWENVLPDLQEALVPLGLDVQLVDVHLGSVLDHAYQARLFKQHMEEIQLCHEESVGPFFLCLVGDQWGPSVLPLEIEEEEYNYLIQYHQMSEEALELLGNSYKEVPSAASVVYKLQDLQDTDVEVIKQRHAALQKLLQQAVTSYSEEAVAVSASLHQKLPSAALEAQIEQALKIDGRRCLFILRNFQRINSSDPLAHQYLDTKEDRTVDKEAERKLTELKDKILLKVNTKNCCTFNVKWQDGGLQPCTDYEHAQYMDKFHSSVVEMVLEFNYQQSETKLGRFHHDTLSHLVRFSDSLQRVERREFQMVESDIRSKIKYGDTNLHQMVLVHGSEEEDCVGCLCYVYSIIRDMFSEGMNLICHFVGLTAQTFLHQDLLRLLYKHVSILFNRDMLSDEKDCDVLVQKFKTLLHEVSLQNTRLIIVICDLEKLQILPEQKHDQHLSWLTCSLPPKVHVLGTYTYSSRSVATFNRIYKSCLTDRSLLAVPTVTQQVWSSLIIGKLGDDTESKKMQFEQQLQQLSLKADLCPVEVVRHALCFFPGEGTPNFASHQSCTNWILQIVINQFGRTIVTAVERYLSATKYGLTEVELLDLLSANHDVMVACLMKGNWKCSNIQRFPVTLWIQIRNALGPLLESMLVHGKKLWCWRRKSTRNTVNQICFQSNHDIKKCHADITDLFLETWVNFSPQALESNPDSMEPAMQFIQPQPLLYSDTKYNLRRLVELPFNILHSGEIYKLKEQCYCNYEYLLARMHSTSVLTLISELETMLRRVIDIEIHTVLQCLQYSLDTLMDDPLQLASELIGRLRPLKAQYPGHISTLVQQCMEWCDLHPWPLIVPLTLWLPDPRVASLRSLECQHKVLSLVSTSNSQHIFCGTSNMQVLMYHLPSGKLIKSFSGPHGAVCCLAISPDNRRLFGGSQDSTVHMWEVQTGNTLHVMREHQEAILSVCISNNGSILATGSRDHTCKLISLPGFEVLHTIQGHLGPVSCVMFNSTDTVLVTSGMDHSVNLWSTEGVALMSTICDEINSPVVCLAVSQNNTFLIIGCEDGSLQVKSLTTGTDIHHLTGHKGKVVSLAMSKDCIHLVAGCGNGKVYMYNLCTKELLHVYKGHVTSPATALISKDEQFIISTAEKEVFVRTMLKKETIKKSTDEHQDTITCLSVSKDKKMAITGSRDQTVRTWILDVCDIVMAFVGHSKTVTCVDIVDQEAFAVSGSRDCSVKVWSMVSGGMVTNYLQHQSPLQAVHVLTDNQRVLSADASDMLLIWLAETGGTLMSVNGPTKLLQMSPDTSLVVCGEGNSLKVWESSTGSFLGIPNHIEQITCITFSPDSKYLVTGAVDKSLKVFEGRKAKLTQVLVGHDGAVCCAAITKDNLYVVSGATDHMIIIWNTTLGAIQHKMKGHRGVVTVVRVTEDGTLALSGSEDGVIKVWSISTGTLITKFTLHVPVIDFHIKPDASYIAVHLKQSRHLPLLCLHNTPAGASKSNSQVSLYISGESRTLPLKPRMSQISTCSYFTYKVSQLKMRRSSSSSLPEIVKVSPMKASLQTTVQAQESRKVSRQRNSAFSVQKTQSKPGEKEQKSSGICTML